MAAAHGLQCGLAALTPILASGGGRVSQAVKGEPLQTPARQITDVVRLDDPACCTDGGMTSAQFVPGVGPVQWREPDIVPGG